MTAHPYRFTVCLLLALVSFAGCGAGRTKDARKQEVSHLRSLVSLYNYAAATLRRPPRSEEEFKQFIEEKGGPMLERLQVTAADELFVSERDGQPFVVLYGKPLQGVAPDLVAYEQTGLDGTRQVAYTLGMIQDVDETQFRELVPAGAVTN